MAEVSIPLSLRVPDEVADEAREAGLRLFASLLADGKLSGDEVLEALDALADAAIPARALTAGTPLAAVGAIAEEHDDHLVTAVRDLLALLVEELRADDPKVLRKRLRRARRNGRERRVRTLRKRLSELRATDK